MSSPGRIIVYKNNGYLARKQDAPTVFVTNIARQYTTNENTPLPKNSPISSTPYL
ncbi:MAG: hypothetical protein F6K18_23325 [Okeania sp. SIO2C2]|uniref:hypothetical protein n=1 Tax=Okeania sp. SIO2C2 TaxID=2607787 RepID=UPI0013B5C018|nr:hypothetical protein [Okeania sp. SIO2C2]NEP89525.1 hypothetical protein [Okeania sp. SIO2C2]